MKKSQKFCLFLITLVITLSCFSFNAIGSTTIEDSEVYVEEGDNFTWRCTYITMSLQPFVCCVGATIKLTIEDIYRGSHGPATYALLVNITKVYTVPGDPPVITNHPTYIAYNKSLNYLSLVSEHIVPIPLNLTLVADYYESLGETTEVDGNKLSLVNGDMREEYTYNSNGLLTKFEYKSFGNVGIRWTLVGASDDTIIYVIVFSVIGVVAVVAIGAFFFLKRRRAS